MTDSLLTGAAIEAVAKLERERGQIHEVDGRKYSSIKLYDPREAEREPNPVLLHSLQGFADIVNGGEDDGYRGNHGMIFVHVAGPEKVVLYTGLFGEFNQRVELARAHAVVPDVVLGQFRDQESFIIEILSGFEPTGDREAIFQVVGNLAHESVRTDADDGVSQVAEARAGIIKKAQVAVPSPATLTPFGSFAEIEQVARPFILRLRGGGDGKAPRCALFPCDGGRWRLEAISRIKTWLRAEINPEIKIYG